RHAGTCLARNAQSQSRKMPIASPPRRLSMIKKATLWSSAAVLCSTLMACERDNEQPAQTAEGTREPVTNSMPSDTVQQPQQAGQEQVQHAKAELKAAEGQDIEGNVELFSTADGVRIVAEVEDATPGKHGLHIHERGDCSNIMGESMGGHFAPEKQQHALPAEGSDRHLGDLGNIE